MFCALSALRNEIWEVKIAIQFRTAKMVTRLTKYWNIVAADLLAFNKPSTTQQEDIATAHTGLPLPRVFAKILGA